MQQTVAMQAATPAPDTHRARNDTDIYLLRTEVGSWREAHVSGRVHPNLVECWFGRFSSCMLMLR